MKTTLRRKDGVVGVVRVSKLSKPELQAIDQEVYILHTMLSDGEGSVRGRVREEERW